MKNSKTLLLWVLILFVACKNEKQTEGEIPIIEQPETPIQKVPTKLIVNIDNLRLRSTAGEDGDEVARLSKGTIVLDMGEISDFNTRIKLRGIQFNEPWIKVKTDKGVKGWVYAGGLHFYMANASQLSETLLQKRLQNMFGASIARQLKIYRTNYNGAATSSDFAKVYRSGLVLRDTMVEVMEENILTVDYEKIADLYWLEQAMPGYRVQLAAEGTIYYLFNDYSFFQKKALATRGKEDDGMAKLFFSVFAVDSVEHFFPAWFLQTWDYGGSSLLGQGVHFEILQKMEESGKSSIFQKEIDDLRERLIQDIAGPGVSYWESKKRILDELDKILDQGFQQFSRDDVIALKTRRKMFEDPKANKIILNHRIGE